MSKSPSSSKYTYPEGATKAEKRKIRRAARKAASPAQQNLMLEAIAEVKDMVQNDQPPVISHIISASTVEELFPGGVEVYPEDQADFGDPDASVTMTKAEWKAFISDLTDEDLADEISALLPKSFAKAASSKIFTLELSEEALSYLD